MIRDLATVITSMLSAIPWLGADFVQFVIIYLSAMVFILLYNVVLPTMGHVNVRALRGVTPRTLCISLYVYWCC